MRKLDHKSQKGFTIIEVMIVLAIAGLIMLIVFMAVPALQRSSRNNGRTNDISRIASAVNEWVSNANGQKFTAGTGNANLASVITQTGTFAQYTLNPAATCTAANSFCVRTGAQAALAIDAVAIVTGAKCDTSTVGATVAPAGLSARSMAIQYQKEGGGGNVKVCTDI
jgi:prepilin-type N-terminal cleavage/methylation domain-containing protein